MVFLSTCPPPVGICAAQKRGGGERRHNPFYSSHSDRPGAYGRGLFPLAEWVPQARRGRGLEAKEFGAPEAKGRLLTPSPILLH